MTLRRPFIERTPNRSLLLFAMGSSSPFREMEPPIFSPNVSVQGPTFALPTSGSGSFVVSYRNSPCVGKHRTLPLLGLTLLLSCGGWEFWGKDEVVGDGKDALASP
jgi:hypothetical protein